MGILTLTGLCGEAGVAPVGIFSDVHIFGSLLTGHRKSMTLDLLSFGVMLLGAWNGLDASAECAEIWNSSWKPWFDKRKTPSLS